jgi:macrodomain Ter protein organizer (MatP/YcbG family)
MGRRIEPLPHSAIDQALSYLQRALERKAPIFAKPVPSTKTSLATLRKKAESLRPAEHGELVNEWLVSHLTPAGRRTMLATLRRKKADQAGTLREAKSLRLSSRAYADVKRLASNLGQPLSTTIDLVVQVALVDAEFRQRVGRLSVATALK